MVTAHALTDDQYCVGAQMSIKDNFGDGHGGMQRRARCRPITVEHASSLNGHTCSTTAAHLTLQPFRVSRIALFTLVITPTSLSPSSPPLISTLAHSPSLRSWYPVNASSLFAPGAVQWLHHGSNCHSACDKPRSCLRSLASVVKRHQDMWECDAKRNIIERNIFTQSMFVKYHRVVHMRHITG